MEALLKMLLLTPTKLNHSTNGFGIPAIVIKLKRLDFVFPLCVSGLNLFACLQRSIPKLPSAAAKLISFKLCFEMGPACCIKFH
jgi:hypothetical protein